MSKVLNRFSSLVLKQNYVLIDKFCHKNTILFKFNRFSTNCVLNNWTKFNKRLIAGLKPNKFIICANCTSFSTFDDTGYKMPPISGQDFKQALDQLIKDNKVIIFSKTTCPYCSQVNNYLN